jgi:hypothetical protein
MQLRVPTEWYVFIASWNSHDLDLVVRSWRAHLRPKMFKDILTHFGMFLLAIMPSHGAVWQITPSNPNIDWKTYIQNFRIKTNNIPCYNLCRLTCHLWMKFIHEHLFLSIVVKFMYHIHFPTSHNSYFHSYSWMHSCLTIICHNLDAHCEIFWVMLVSCSCWLLEAMHH